MNGADSKAAQVFTLAHELAHLWLGETALSDLDPASVRDNTVERWCNQVAARLLGSLELRDGGRSPRTVPVGDRFARAVIGSAMESVTSYSEAFRLLGVRKAAAFDRLGADLGLSASPTVARS